MMLHLINILTSDSLILIRVWIIWTNIDLDLARSMRFLGVEMKVEFELFGKKFIGFIDLLVRDKNQRSRSIIIDHKSASIKILKNGNISKSDQATFLRVQTTSISL